MTDKETGAAFELPYAPKGVSSQAKSISYVLATAVTMILALNGIIQFFGGNAYSLEEKQQTATIQQENSALEGLLQTTNGLLNQNNLLIEQNTQIVEQNRIVIEQSNQILEEMRDLRDDIIGQ